MAIWFYSSHQFNIEKKRRTPLSKILLILLGSIGIYSPTLLAQPAQAAEKPAESKAAKPVVLQAVTVRSRNRIEKLQDVPLSVSVVSGPELERTQAVDIAAFSKRVGNVTWNPGNPRQFSLSVRGIGKQGQTDAQDPSVGIIVDGVNYAYNPLSSSVDFTDIASVEVTRGPQGTLLGKNTSLGVINITTRRPTFTPEANATISYGTNNDLFASAVLGGPVVDDLLAWRGVFSAHKGDGDIVNLYNPDLTYANKDRFAARVQFLLTPSEDFTARLSLDAQPKAGEATNGRSFNSPTPTEYSNGSTNLLASDAKTRLNRSWFLDQSDYRYEDDWLGNSERDAINADNYNPIVTGTNGASVELNWQLSEHEITSITAYKDYYFDARNDEGTPFDISKNGGGLVDYKQYSQELRLSSNTGGFFDYQTGVFFLTTDIAHSTRNGWGSDAGAWFATPTQYSRLEVNTNGRALMQDSLSRLYRDQENQYDNSSGAVFAQANWHFTEPFTLTTGVRFTKEDRQTTSSALIADNGAGAPLNPESIDVVNQVPLGGFNSYATNKDLTTGATVVIGALTPDNTPEQIALANALAQKYFGNSNYAALGAPETRQVADAKAIRKTQTGALWNTVEAESYQDTQPAFVLSPSYKFSEELSSYLSWQYGEKAGIAQVVNGFSYPTKAEKSNSYELGVKTVLLDNTLVFNADIFYTNIEDYQQSVRVVDEYTTQLNTSNGAPEIAYLAYTGNVPKVHAEGLEIDGIYSGLSNTSIRFSGTYNDAYYVEFSNSAQPVENGYTGAPAFQDISGETLPGAFKYSFNIGVDYRIPVLDHYEFHTSFNTSYNSKFNSDNALSSYGWIDASTSTDFSIGIGEEQDKFDVNLVVKNLFDDDTYQSKTWNSWTPAIPRSVHLVVSGKF